MPLPKPVLMKYANEVFVETGTLYGEAVRIALDCGFKQVHSVDIDKTLADAQRNNYGSKANMHFYAGSSGDLLPIILPKITGRITFWLDAHPPGMPLLMSATPLMAEIAAIKVHTEKLSGDSLPIILIDDMRIFSTEDKDKLREAIAACFKGAFSFEDNGVAPDDILVYKPVV